MKEGLDWIARGVANAVGEAVTDIRQKVVEESWFGRVVTPEVGLESSNSAKPDVSVSVAQWWTLARDPAAETEKPEEPGIDPEGPMHRHSR